MNRLIRVESIDYSRSALKRIFSLVAIIVNFKAILTPELNADRTLLNAILNAERFGIAELNARFLLNAELKSKNVERLIL